MAGQSVRAKAAESDGVAQPAPRLEEADRVGTSICPFCAVGCAQLIYTKDGRPIHIEGDPRSPVNQGTLCPKGAGTLGMLLSPERITTVLYRAPYATQWERKPLDWAMDRIAERVKQTRDETFVENLPDGRVVNHTLGSARSAAPPWTTRKTTSSRSCSAAASGWSTSRTRPASDTRRRCPVWGRRSGAVQPPWLSGTWKTPIASW